MTNDVFVKTAERCFQQIPENSVRLPLEAADIPVLEAPLIGLASADDPLFTSFSDPSIIGTDWRSPKEWLPGARSVAAFFFPFTEEVRSRHSSSDQPVTEAWNLAYRRHQQITESFIDLLTAKLEEQGIRTFVPTRDRSFVTHPIPVKNGDEEDIHYSVSWSNRHVAYVAGLGTFGIHRHLITEKGCCGGFASVIVDCELEPTVRNYDDPYEYCTRCGACLSRCPAGAITLENLRNLKKCGEHAARIREEHGGFCGKCLVGIPCEHEIPSGPLRF